MKDGWGVGGREHPSVSLGTIVPREAQAWVAWDMKQVSPFLLLARDRESVIFLVYL